MAQASGLVLDHLWDIAARMVATATAHRLVFDQVITADTVAGMVAGMVVIVADMPSRFTETPIRSTVEVMVAITDVASSTVPPTLHVLLR